MENDIPSRFNKLMKRLRIINKPGLIGGKLYRTEFFILVAIKEYEKTHGQCCDGIKPSKLAEMTGTSISAASKQIRTIEEKGYIERAYSRDDKRVVYIRLTESGNKIIEEVKGERDAIIHKIESNISKEKMNTFLDIGEEIIKIIEEEREEYNRCL